MCSARPRASDKKKLILAGKLTEKGRPNEKTPRAWLLGQGRWSWLPKLTGSMPAAEYHPTVFNYRRSK
eukprot:4654121-Amphidinium_carterae.1